MKAPSFEHQLNRLEEIAAELERPDVPLDTAIALFAEGQELLKRASDTLASAEGRLRELVEKADVVVDGQVVLADVPVTYLLFLEKQLTAVNGGVKPGTASDADIKLRFQFGPGKDLPVELRADEDPLLLIPA